MKIKINTLLFFIVILLAIYQDFPLVNTFGELARSPIVFITVPMLVYLLLQSKIVFSKYTLYYIYYIGYLGILSLLFLPLVYYYNESFVVLRENIVIKSIKLLTYPLVILIFYQFILTLFRKSKSSFDSFFNALFIIQILIAIFLFFEVIFLKKSTLFASFLHANDIKYYRVRLLTYEESWAGTILTFFVFVPLFLVNYLEKSIRLKRFVYVISSFIFFYYILFSESKGFLLLVIVSILPMSFQYLFHNGKVKKNLLIVIPVLIAIVFFVLAVLKQNIEQQLNTSITFGTRFTSYLASLKVFIEHPFGVGWGGFTYYYPNAIRDIINSSWVSTLNLEEVKGYLGTTKALSTKTDFFDNLIYGGIGSIYFYYLFFIKRYFYVASIKNATMFFIKVPLIFSILAGFIYITYYIKYEVWLLMAFLDALESQMVNSEIECNENSHNC